MTIEDIAVGANFIYIMLALLALTIAILYLAHQIGKKNDSRKK